MAKIPQPESIHMAFFRLFARWLKNGLFALRRRPNPTLGGGIVASAGGAARQNKMVVAPGFVGFVAADQNLGAVVMRRKPIDNPLRIRSAAAAFSAVRSHPHTSVFG